MMGNKNKELPKVLKDWKRAVAELNVDKVMANYHAGAVFKGTLVDNLVEGADNIRPYFSDYFLRDKKTLSCVFNEVQKVSRPKALSKHYVGKYTFTYEDVAGQQGNISAHFSFYTKKDKATGREVIKFHGSYKI